MTHKHIAGPWHIGYGGMDGDDYATITSKFSQHPIAQLEPVGYVQANAHLIAAAPELLDLCKFATGFVARHKQKDDGMNLHADLLAAIAKAEGRQ